MDSMVLSHLEEVNLFADLTASHLEDIGKFCQYVTLHEGDTLIQENSRDVSDLYALVKGTVEIVSSESSVASAECELSREDNELFGEIGWLTSRKRTASVRCRGEVEAIRIDGEKLKVYLESRPEVGYMIMKRIALLIAARLETTNSLLKQILWNARI